MTDKTKMPPGNKWEHPTHLEKVKRNLAGINPNNADDHPNPVPAPKEGFTLDNVKPLNPDGH